jgi:hypothetical protein
MAAPHVAGTGAILAERHPGWGGEAIKAALMSTSVRVPGESVYDAGAGRVDVAAAVDSAVVARDGTVDFGLIPYSETPYDIVTRTVAFANTSEEAVEVDLALEVTDDLGAAAPDGMFTLSTQTLTIPAHGSADVDVTLDPNLGETRLYGGHLTATAPDGSSVHSSVGASKQPRTVQLVVDGVSQNGAAAAGGSSVDVWGLDSDLWFSGGFGDKKGPGPAVFTIPAGTYSVSSFLWNLDDAGVFGRELALVAEPEVEIEEDTHLVLDATGAQPSDPVTPRDSEHREATLGYYRASERHSFSTHYLLDRYVPTVFLEATEPFERGELDVSEHWELYAPELEMTADGAQVEAEYAIGSTRVDGTRSWGMVDAGQARPSDLARVDVRGKVALVEYADDLGVEGAARAVEEAGAVAALVYYNQPGFLLGGVDAGIGIPVFTAEQQVGHRLRDLAGKRALQVKGTPVSPYVYDIFEYWEDSVPATIDRTVEHSELARFRTRYYGVDAAQQGAEIRFPFRPYDGWALRQAIQVPVPSTRTEWVSPGEVTWHQVSWAAHGVGDSVLVDTRREYTPGQRGNEDWFAPVARPGTPLDNDHYGQWGMPGYREGDTLTILVRSILDSGQHYSEDLITAARFYRDGVLVAEGTGIAGQLPASASPARYRLELDVEREAPWWRLSTRTSTAWEFTSSRPAPEQSELLGLLQADYEVATDMRGRVESARPTEVGVEVHRQGSASPAMLDDLTVRVSYDEGATWHRLSVEPAGDGYAVRVQPPRRASSVSLQLRAQDADGNEIEQEVIRASTPRWSASTSSPGRVTPTGQATVRSLRRPPTRPGPGPTCPPSTTCSPPGRRSAR